MSELHTDIARYVHNRVHECAPGHSLQEVELDSLRAWAKSAEEMADVLEACAYMLRGKPTICRMIEMARCGAMGGER